MIDTTALGGPGMLALISLASGIVGILGMLLRRQLHQGRVLTEIHLDVNGRLTAALAEIESLHRELRQQHAAYMAACYTPAYEPAPLEAEMR